MRLKTVAFILCDSPLGPSHSSSGQGSSDPMKQAPDTALTRTHCRSGGSTALWIDLVGVGVRPCLLGAVATWRMGFKNHLISLVFKTFKMCFLL